MRVKYEIGQILGAFSRNWKLFLGIHVAANLVYLLVLAPLSTLLFGWLVLASGDVALTDEDILFFLLSPTGFLIFVLASAMLATLLVFEQGALFIAAFQARQGNQPGITRLIRYVLERSPALFSLAVRMVVRGALVAAPFLAVAAGIFFMFLTEFDINFYLHMRPPVFWWAGAGILLCLLAMAWALFRVFAGWIIALPLLLLERDTPAGALRESRDLAASMRWPIASALLGLLLVNALLLGLTGGLLDLGVLAAGMLAGESLRTMAYLMGGLLVLWSLTNLAVTFFTTCALALGMLELFLHLFPDSRGRRLDERLAPSADNRRWKVSGTASAAILLLLLVGAGFVLDTTLDRLKLGGHAQIIAHRGASMDAPGNTLAAMEEAIAQGADWLEIDVQETRQGEIVVVHDRDLKKVGGSPLRIWDATLADLEEIDVGSWFDPKFAAERVPTLRELLLQVKGRIKVNIELKYYGQEQRFEELVAGIVEEVGMEDEIVIMSLKPGGVRKMKSLRPDWEVGLLSSVAVGDVTRLEADFFAVNGRFATRSFIKRAHGREHEVLVWTINDPVMMSAMMSKQVDGIITDKPGLAVRVRQERFELGLAELFMIRFASLSGRQALEVPQ